MVDTEPFQELDEIANLEIVHWAKKGESFRERALEDGLRVERLYKTFAELYCALEEHGPFIIASSMVDVVFVAVGGEFDGHVMVVRQSGRNIRRFLIRSDTFEDEYGSFQNCLDHMGSNNAVGVEIELKHLKDLAETLNLDPEKIDPARSYGRLETDIIAALQLWGVAQDLAGDDPETDYVFRLGFSVGRLFSSAQNLATLEPDADRAMQYEKSYRERGKKGKSKDRRAKRLDHLFAHIQKLVNVNPDLSRMKPIEVAKLALSDAVEEDPDLWSQGQGQLEVYLSAFASEDKFRKLYRAMFPQTG
ncbi:hypothetical protein [uncultured Roseobacter sp.]|uniref:hypothetical protein n=1 Tax=uncultured Roseobacter sp. TaxID=114847 RepID=UPI00260B3B6B|nr:hypothetical protein [uncultured Roseobacter sp.]